MGRTKAAAQPKSKRKANEPASAPEAEGAEEPAVKKAKVEAAADGADGGDAQQEQQPEQEEQQEPAEEAGGDGEGDGEVKDEAEADADGEDAEAEGEEDAGGEADAPPAPAAAADAAPVTLGYRAFRSGQEAHHYVSTVLKNWHLGQPLNEVRRRGARRAHGAHGPSMHGACAVRPLRGQTSPRFCTATTAAV